MEKLIYSSANLAIMQKTKNGFAYLYELYLDNALIGDCCIMLDESDSSLNVLWSFNIVSHQRQKGYASLFLTKICDFLHKNEYKSLDLYVRVENDRAYNLYKKRGFNVVETITEWQKIYHMRKIF